MNYKLTERKIQIPSIYREALCIRVLNRLQLWARLEAVHTSLI